MPFDVPSFLLGKQSGGGGGGDVTVESKSISANGTYTAPTGKAYSPVTVNVANSYAAGDEGKVVSSGALVSQTAHAEVTENGTIDTTLNNSVVVNVPASSSWTLISTDEFEVSTTSTAVTTVGAIVINVESVDVGDIFWVHIRDKAGKRNGYFLGSDSIIIQYGSYSFNNAKTCIVARTASDGTLSCSAASAGVYANGFSAAKTIDIVSKYNSSSSLTIDGTYKVDVYKLTPPFTMFE